MGGSISIFPNSSCTHGHGLLTDTSTPICFCICSFLKEAASHVLWNQNVVTSTQQLSYTGVLYQEFMLHNNISQHKLRQYSVIPEGIPKKILLVLLKRMTVVLLQKSASFFKFHSLETSWTSALRINLDVGHPKLTPSLKKMLSQKIQGIL